MPELLQAEPCFIIHARAYKERSRLLEIFTLNYGRICVMARAVKKPALQALLQPFVPLKLDLLRGRSEIWNLSECWEAGSEIRLRLPLSLCASYLNELLYYLLKPGDPAAELFGSYLSALRALEQEKESEIALRRFELTLLEHLGMAPDFSCFNQSLYPGYPGADPDQPIPADALFCYSLQQGFCPVNRSEAQNCPLPVLSVRQLKLLAAQDLTLPESQKALKLLTRFCLNALLNGRILKSRQLYRDYLHSISA